MTAYEDRLTSEQLGMMKDEIESFLDSFATHQGEPLQRSFIFFPGGMGSELVRSNKVFNPGLPGGSYGYETLWVDLMRVILEEAALLLQMNGNQDSSNRFILANGALKNCALAPYDNVATWCTANHLDLLMVGWDFRRNADWNVNFFLQVLVPEVRRRASQRGLGDPFKGATMVGHSFGGMVVKWILNKYDDPFCQNLRLAITVATPFYGSTGQTQRLFTSEPMLGPFYDADDVTKTIATMPGGYSLFFLDSQTYDDYKGKLSADPDFPLDRYPSFDKDDHSIRVDPYKFQASNPQNPHLCRYPIKGPNPANNWTWFEGYLNGGLKDYARAAVPLDASVRSKLHNIRGVQTSAGVDAAATKIMQRWGWYDVTQNRMPQAADVIKTFGGPGDGVIPAWSARLVTQDQANIHTIRGDMNASVDLEHMTMMDYPAVRSTLLSLIKPGAAQAFVQTPTLTPAPKEELENVRLHIEQLAATRAMLPAKVAVKQYIDALSPEQQRALALRWFIELPKGAPPSERLR